MSDVVVFGTGDFARMARIYLDQDSPHQVQAFTVHERYLDRRRSWRGPRSSRSSGSRRAILLGATRCSWRSASLA